LETIFFARCASVDGHERALFRREWMRIFAKDVRFDIRAIRCSELRSKVRAMA